MTISTTALTGFLVLCAGALGTWGCVSSDKDDGATGGTSGTTGGSTGTGGTGGASSTGGTGGDAGMATACPTPTATLITDFSMPDTVSTTDKVIFTGPPGGGTYYYPTPTDTPTPMYPLTSDVSKGSWHLSGMLGTYSGFGLYFDNCSKLDASAYKGIKFKISGSVGMGNGINLTVSTAADEVASSWLNAHKANATDPDKTPNFGRCMPAAAQYDNTCLAPTKLIPVTETETTVTVLWTELMGGKPAAGVDPKEITAIAWGFVPPAGAGTASPTPYAADVTIDDLEFVP